MTVHWHKEVAMSQITRRTFVRLSAKGAALAAGASVMAAARPAAAAPASEKVVLALVGAGGRGYMLAQNFAKIENVEFKYVCEVNEPRGAKAAGELEKVQGRRPQSIGDFRDALADKDVHGVIVATPEHWHALATIWACQAGKDVYVEKTPSLTIWEGRQMIRAARKYNRIVQVGTQNRSAPYAVTARDYLKRGDLGKIVHVKVYNILGVGGGLVKPQPDGSPPAGLHWDLWLGPAPERPFNPGRLRWLDWWDYCGGTLSGDGIHQLDLTRMVLGDPPPPLATYCAGGRLAFDDHHEMPDMQAITYDCGTFTMTCENACFAPYMKKIPPEIRNGDKFPNWPTTGTRVEIYGTKRLMYLGRHGGGWQVLDQDGKTVDQDKSVSPDKWHQPNFIDCIRTRRPPNADIEQGHLSACLVHFGNIATRTGNQRLVFDPKTETFVGNDAANKFLKPAYRKAFQVPDEV
jgi:predicted dehydrogenase